MGREALPTPPLTKRGCLTPDSGDGGSEGKERHEVGREEVLFHVDYLKLTVFREADEVKQLVESGLYDAGHVGYEEWEDGGKGKRWASIWQNVGPVAILVPKHNDPVYCVVELKGEACTRFGPELLQGLMVYLTDTRVRWHSCRIDLAFDHVQFTPYMVRDAIERGDFNSRCLSYIDRDWNENHWGATAYLGGRKSDKDRRLRVYDKRGFNRCEAEFTGDWSRTAARRLALSPVETWPELAIGLMRGMVDFVDHAANERIERCPLLPWWGKFVGGAEKMRRLDEEDRRQLESKEEADIIAETERRFDRYGKLLAPMIIAFGAGYVGERLHYYGAERLRAEDEEFIRALRLLGKEGKAGPSYGELDDVPF